jgi:hypothetical protein
MNRALFDGERLPSIAEKGLNRGTGSSLGTPRYDGVECHSLAVQTAHRQRPIIYIHATINGNTGYFSLSKAFYSVHTMIYPSSSGLFIQRFAMGSTFSHGSRDEVTPFSTLLITPLLSF